MKFIHISILFMFCSVIIGLLPDLFRYTISQNNKQNSPALVLYVNDITQIDGFMIVGNFKIPVSLARNETERIKGLSGTHSMPNKYGMFFDFEHSDYQSMWMKDMLFPIDIVWIDEDYKIVHIEKIFRPTHIRKFSPRRSKRVLSWSLMPACQRTIIYRRATQYLWN